MSEHVHSPQCKQMLGSLSEYIDGALQAELCAAIEEHLKDCPNCRVVINTLRKTVELYEKAVPPAELPSGIRERLFARLELDEFITPPTQPS
ncbi:MAG TPA: zf-HC2 domain-containing protein [Anaerolineaceae bacterium]|nr:zf-HC2 domain-containing protein [Anaerolineaceae bacterium]HPN54189.1 zf-HC2 domain-containing protein [Anaerolineaceae bacterium]